MNLSFKQELIIGFLSIFIITALIVVRIVSYENQAAQFTPTSLKSNTSTNQKAQTNALTIDEILKHSTPADCWIIVEQKVYNVTEYITRHPGGERDITSYCGKDATQPFLTQDGRGSHSVEAFRILGILYVGDVNGTVIQQPDTKAVQQIPVKGKEEEDDD